MKIIIISMLIIILGFQFGRAQIKGEPPPELNPDSTYIFKSPRSLIFNEEAEKSLKSAWGIDLLFSGNGFGAGAFYQKAIADEWFIFTSLYISGARNSDEFEYYFYDPNTGRWDLKIPDKVNRLYMFPLTFGIQKYIFSKELSETFSPFVNAGCGPTFILSTPYNMEFFSSFSKAQFFTRFGAFIGGGAYFSGISRTLMGVNARYYFIPFGGDGLESIKNMPIKDFGGIFLSLSIGIRF